MSSPKKIAVLALRRAGRVPFDAVARLAYYSMLRTAHRIDVNGFQVIVAGAVESDTREKAMQAIRMAIQSIEVVDSNLFAIMRRTMNRIVVVPGQSIAYNVDLRICRLGADFAAVTHGNRLAVSLVHEYAHARVIRRGIPMRFGAALQKMESISTKREIAFVRRMIKHGWKIQPYLDLLLAQSQKPYDLAAVRAAQLKDMKTQGAPWWVVAMRRLGYWIEG